MSNLINVSVDFVIAALEDHYESVKDNWGCEASEALWEQALDLVKECGLGAGITSPSIYVDNYLINGEFVSKEDDFDHWTKDYQESHDFSDGLDVEAAWDEYCQDNALLYNDKYACLQF